MKAWIPNSITLLNLFCGCAAVINILQLEFNAAFWFVFAAGVLDFADGLVARLLNVSSTLGKELDSLADMVSFGVVPGTIFYTLLWLGEMTNEVAILELRTQGFSVDWRWMAAPGFLVTCFSALRLAKFNLDERQTEDFIGLATPSSTLFALGLMWILDTNAFGWGMFTLSPWLIYPSIIIISLLLISEIPMFSFKLKQFGWAGNGKRYIFAAIAVALLVFMHFAALPFIVLTYLIINLADNFFGASA